MWGVIFNSLFLEKSNLIIYIIIQEEYVKSTGDISKVLVDLVILVTDIAIHKQYNQMPVLHRPREPRIMIRYCRRQHCKAQEYDQVQ